MPLTLPQRKPLRLPQYDYSQNGAYYVTLCTQNKECLFGEVVDGEMVLNDAGRIVKTEWMQTQHLRNDIILDEFVIMPNHMHMIICFVGANRCSPAYNAPGELQRGEPRFAPTKTVLGNIFKGFKCVTAVKINQHRQTPGVPLWQRGYYDHVVRNEADLTRIREYIANNPAQWALDANNPTVGASAHELWKQVGSNRGSTVGLFAGEPRFAPTHALPLTTTHGRTYP